MGLFSSLFGSRKSSNSGGCKTYKTKKGPTITQCQTGTKTFKHTKKTKKGTRTTSYTYGK